MLSVLSYSGGKQSTCILEMVLREHIPKPEHFLVVNANPGAENSNTYKLILEMKNRCLEKGIRFEIADGPNLYKDLLNCKDKDRIDNPPFFVKKENNKKGKLRHKCTYYYKILPIHRTIRIVMEELFGIPRKSRKIPIGFVDQWIGFSKDEEHRIKESERAFINLKYPLIELNMTTSDVIDYFKNNNIAIPDRSVCNFCFSNGLRFYKEMCKNRPDDFNQAILIDEHIRNNLPSVNYETYINDTLIPLRILKEMNFDLGDNKENDKHQCNSGACFL